MFLAIEKIGGPSWYSPYIKFESAFLISARAAYTYNSGNHKTTSSLWSKNRHNVPISNLSNFLREIEYLILSTQNTIKSAISTFMYISPVYKRPFPPFFQPSYSCAICVSLQSGLFNHQKKRSIGTLLPIYPRGLISKANLMGSFDSKKIRPRIFDLGPWFFFLRFIEDAVSFDGRFLSFGWCQNVGGPGTLLWPPPCVLSQLQNPPSYIHPTFRIKSLSSRSSPLCLIWSSHFCERGAYTHRCKDSHSALQAWDLDLHRRFTACYSWAVLEPSEFLLSRNSEYSLFPYATLLFPTDISHQLNYSALE